MFFMYLKKRNNTFFDNALRDDKEIEELLNQQRMNMHEEQELPF
jgi:hypothetical protein